MTQKSIQTLKALTCLESLLEKSAIVTQSYLKFSLSPWTRLKGLGSIRSQELWRMRHYWSMYLEMFVHMDSPYVLYAFEGMQDFCLKRL